MCRLKGHCCCHVHQYEWSLPSGLLVDVGSGVAAARRTPSLAASTKYRCGPAHQKATAAVSKMNRTRAPSSLSLGMQMMPHSRLTASLVPTPGAGVEGQSSREPPYTANARAMFSKLLLPPLHANPPPALSSGGQRGSRGEALSYWYISAPNISTLGETSQLSNQQSRAGFGQRCLLRAVLERQR